MQVGYMRWTACEAQRKGVEGAGEAMNNVDVLSPSPAELWGAANKVTLRELVDFYERKLLTEEEFKVAKMKLLGMDVSSVVRETHSEVVGDIAREAHAEKNPLATSGLYGPVPAVHSFQI